MEEDAGKNTHGGADQLSGSTGSGVDLNRAGVPLLEIVTEPDFRRGVEAAAYGDELRRIVRFLGISDGNMQARASSCVLTCAWVAVCAPAVAFAPRMAWCVYNTRCSAFQCSYDRCSGVCVFASRIWNAAQLFCMSTDPSSRDAVQEGSLRCDVNVSVRPEGRERLGTKVEVKNMNSFSAMQKAIDFETARQTGLLRAGRDDELVQETRLFDENRQVRTKIAASAARQGAARGRLASRARIAQRCAPREACSACLAVYKYSTCEESTICLS